MRARVVAQLFYKKRQLERPFKLAPPLHALSDWAIAFVRRLLSQSGAGR